MSEWHHSEWHLCTCVPSLSWPDSAAARVAVGSSSDPLHPVRMQAMCEGAMEKLLQCDWGGMSPLEVALCQNAFQTSDPTR